MWEPQLQWHRLVCACEYRGHGDARQENNEENTSTSGSWSVASWGGPLRDMLAPWGPVTDHESIVTRWRMKKKV